MENRIFFFILYDSVLSGHSDTITIQQYITETSQKRRNRIFFWSFQILCHIFPIQLPYNCIFCDGNQSKTEIRILLPVSWHSTSLGFSDAIVPIWRKPVKKGGGELFSGLLKFFLIMFYWYNYHFILFFNDFEKLKTEPFSPFLKFYFIRFYCTIRISVINIYNLTFYILCYRIFKLP